MGSIPMHFRQLLLAIALLLGAAFNAVSQPSHASWPTLPFSGESHGCLTFRPFSSGRPFDKSRADFRHLDKQTIHEHYFNHKM
jgi:hypothetical protein